LKLWHFETLKTWICLTIKKKFVLALIGYAVFGVLAWNTLSDEPIRVFNGSVRLRTATLLILGLFALRTSLHFWRTRIEEERESAKPLD
jgi:hypothetical protein